MKVVRGNVHVSLIPLVHSSADRTLALALALALSLDDTFPYRDRLLDLTFGVVVFSILVQALTMKPLLRVLGLADGRA
jgi:NhaP-type Na+/H+ or K+/H+ antiporter